MSDIKEKEETKSKNIVREYAPYVVALIVIILLKIYIVTPIRVNGASMNTTLKDGDIMILNIIGLRFEEIERFDIVVVKTDNDLIIKRVIGLPGETIEYKDNVLYVDGKKIEENYGSKKTADFKKYVPKGSYFVLGDNRTNSLDSRSFGPFKKEKIVGKTSLTIFPFSRIGNKK